MACAAATALAAVGACSGGDEPGERITRIDGPAIVVAAIHVDDVHLIDNMWVSPPA